MIEVAKNGCVRQASPETGSVLDVEAPAILPFRGSKSEARTNEVSSSMLPLSADADHRL